MKFATIFTAASFAVAGFAATAVAQDQPQQPDAGPIEMMFVQQAAGMKFDGKTLTLEGVPPAAVFFSDRPQRLSGHLTQAQFVELWNDSQKDSFEKDPPNAAVSLISKEEKTPVVVELKGASLSGDTLAFEVTVLEGELPQSAGAVALFVDPWVYRPGWRWGGGWGPGWGGGGWGVAGAAAAGAAVGAAVGAAAASPAVNCHYSPYWNQPVCRGVW